MLAYLSLGANEVVISFWSPTSKPENAGGYLVTSHLSMSSALSRFSIQQAVNVPGLLSSLRVFIQPSLVIPLISVKHINDLNFESMKNDGVKCLIFDKDNTLR